MHKQTILLWALCAAIPFGASAQNLDQSIRDVEALKADMKAKMREMDAKMAELDRELHRLKARNASPVASDPYSPEAAEKMVYEKPNRWEAGAEWTLLQVFGAEGGVTFDDSASNDFVDAGRSHEFDGLDSGVRSWISYRYGQDVSALVRYWGYNSRADNVEFTVLDDSAANNPVGSAIGGSSVHLDVFDLEIRRDLAPHRRSWDSAATFGLRYADINHHNQVRTEDGQPGDDAEFFNQDTRFAGFGPTASFEAKQQLGRSRFSTFQSFRGSVLFGEEDENFTFFEDGSIAEPALTDGFNRVIPAFETQIGLEWLRPMRQDRELFLRAAFEAQAWIGATSHSGLIGQQQNQYMESRFFHAGGDLGLMGVTFGGGLRF